MELTPYRKRIEMTDSLRGGLERVANAFANGV